MVDDNTTQMENADKTTPQPPAPVPPIESRFLFVDVAALRAKQLRRGARPRIAALANPDAIPADAPRKAERVAMEEVRQGLVYWELPPVKPEEE